MTITVEALETVMSDGWRAVEEDHLGGWLLRASGGFTQRGNSVLSMGSPGLPPVAAIEVVEQWYAARALPARFCLLTDVSGVPADPDLYAALTGRGYQPASATQSMVAVSAALPSLTEQSPGVVADTQLTPGWMAAFAAYRSVQPEPAEAILTGSRAQLFLSVPAGPDGPLVAIARMSIYPGWAGIHAMWVAPERRRQGLATTVVAAVAQLGREHHMPEVYLQVERANTTAVAAYTAMGFRPHHGHIYLTAQPSRP